jgi:LmbE family N-acetylglucosaminyl deacetylase
MKLHSSSAEIYVPNRLSPEQALGRTTHFCVAAHPDDIEIMAAQPILECFHQPDKAFTGVVVTDGHGSPRDGLYKNFTDEAMRLVRFSEQRKAADVGEYAAMVLLDYPSKVVKDSARKDLVEDLITLLRAAKPQVIYTHNLADKHDTHVAVSLRLIQALRSLDPAERPEKVIGCEIWRSLDWIVDKEKIVMDVSEHQNLQAALLGVFDSQIAGGKRYDTAAMGRRLANATFYDPRTIDNADGLIFGMDLTPLMQDSNLEICAYVQGFIDHLSQDIAARIERLNSTGFHAFGSRL